MSVASVLNPIGERISVTVSSFIACRKTSAAPAIIPPRASGIVIVRKTSAWPRPMPRAASSIRGESCTSELAIGPIASGR
jgi:hypothetical protein